MSLNKSAIVYNSLEYYRRQKSQAEQIRLEEERRILSDMSRIEQDLRDKEIKIEELNRELRKANLQNLPQFRRDST